MKLNTVLVQCLDAPDQIYVPGETFSSEGVCLYFWKKMLIMLMHKFLCLTVICIFFNTWSVGGKKLPNSAQHIRKLLFKTRCTSSS